MTQSGQDLLRTIFRNSFWSTFACAASPILAFLFGGLTVRYVGIEAAGFSAAVGAILGIASRFGSLGMGEAVVPALAAAIGADDRPRVRRLVGLVLSIALASGGMTALGLLAFAPQIGDWTRTTIPREAALTFILISAVTTVVAALSTGMVDILRSASRHDLVTKATLPLSILKGTVGCVLVPLFPSLSTVALVGCCAAVCELPILFNMARRAVPETVHPSFKPAEFASLARYGFWISLTKLVSVLSGGVDDLVITGACGAAALPPWVICKRLWLTMHTFLAQHVEHLIPTLGSVRERSRAVFDSVGAGMHWYITVVAAAGYTFIVWAGPAIIAMVAGEAVANLCSVPLFAFGLAGTFWSLSIIPVISAMALSDARPGFVIALLTNCVQITVLVVVSRMFGVPAVYLAPLAVIPVIVTGIGVSSSRIFDPLLAWSRLQPVLVPVSLGLLAILSSWLAPVDWTPMHRACVGTGLASLVCVLTLVIEHRLHINGEAHQQLFRVVRHVGGLVQGVVRGLVAPRVPEAVER